MYQCILTIKVQYYQFENYIGSWLKLMWKRNPAIATFVCNFKIYCFKTKTSTKTHFPLFRWQVHDGCFDCFFDFFIFCLFSFSLLPVTLIWEVFFRDDFEIQEEGGGITPSLPPSPHFCLKHVKIMLEFSNLTRKYTYFLKITFNNKAFLILLMSVFFYKFSTFNHRNNVRAVLGDIF